MTIAAAKPTRPDGRRLGMLLRRAAVNWQQGSHKPGLSQIMISVVRLQECLSF